MFIKEDFAEGRPISQVPASWFNSVAKFINNLVPGLGIALDKHDDGSASEITVRAGNGLGLNSSNDLCVKVASDGGITSDSNGLKLDSVGTAQASTGFIEGPTQISGTHNRVVIHWPRFDSNGRFVDFGGTTTTIDYMPHY